MLNLSLSIQGVPAALTFYEKALLKLNVEPFQKTIQILKYPLSFIIFAALTNNTHKR